MLEIYTNIASGKDLPEKVAENLNKADRTGDEII